MRHETACHSAMGRGFTLVEAVISMVIVATMFVAALTTISGAAQARRVQAGWRKADGLARLLLAEMQACTYGTTSGTIVSVVILGTPPENRMAFDDLDDFNGLVESPPTGRDGAVLPGYAAWRWSVLVERVDPADPMGASTRSTDKGMKRITVSVQGPAQQTLELTTLRSRWSFADVAPAPGTARAQGAAVSIGMTRGGYAVAGALLPNGPPALVVQGGDEEGFAIPTALGGDKPAESGGLLGVVGGLLGGLLGGGK